MSNQKYIASVVFLIVAIVTFGFIVSNLVSGFHGRSVGSVSQGNEYMSTTTGSFTNASSTYIRVGAGTIAQVTIGSTSNAALVVKDATSISDSGSTTLASFSANVAAGTYTFDSVFVRGLFLNFGAGFNGAYTVTFR